MNEMQQTNQNTIEQDNLGLVQHGLTGIMPMSSEIGFLWTSYYAESMSICFLKRYTEVAEDPDIHAIMQWVLDITNRRVERMEDLFNSINHPIPNAFGEKDVEVNAKKLFSDSFKLLYTRLMHKFISIHYLEALTVSARSDFRHYFKECLNTSVEIHQRATDILIAKGLLLKYPSIVIPDRVDYVHDTGYFGSIIPFIKNKRPLNAIEISHIFSIMETKQLIATLNLGYSQVVKSEKVRAFISKAKQLSDKHLKVLGSALNDEDINVPIISEILVTDSKESTHSDKLILVHVTTILSFVISGYGTALTSTARIDLVSMYRGFINEILTLTKEGAELMIEAGWLERIPETADRKKLTH